MASVTTPTINKIIRLNSYDLLGTKCTKYNMYMCLDTLQLWYDESESKRTLYAYVGVDTVNDLQNNLIPEIGTTYYCWESNSLWLWMNRWVCIYSDGSYPSAYRTDNGTVEAIYLDDQNPTIVDNNGLLRDGSVVIRDPNRVIKGRLYISDSYDNLVISSYLGGGVRILPNGAFSTDGELYIDDDAKSHIRAEWNVLNNEIYVDYHEKPSIDPSTYINDEHRYKVWHEGNLKLEDLQLTGLNIYNKIIEAQKDGTLPNPLVLNVNQLNGLKSTDFALKNHIHSSSDISDFATAAQANANTVLMDKLTNMIFKGAKITWVEASKKYMLSTDNFILSFTGGATGQGTVVNNTNTTIALTIDPTKHTHSDLEARITALEASSGTADLSDYYNKSAIDDMFSATPVQGKALLVNSSKTLPANAQTASDLDHNTKLTLDGDITGNVTFGYENTALTLTTNADKIISSTATAGKALKLDSNADLPAKSYSAKELDHEISVELIGDVTGTASLDTSENKLQITTKIGSSAENAVPWSAVGVDVASLDDDGIVPLTQLPEGIMSSLKLVGTWTGGSAPSSNPVSGQAWVVTQDVTWNGTHYAVGDWIYYYNSSWNRIDIGQSVKSVNGYKTESITLDYDDVNAVSDEYINYTLGAQIPANKAVVTDSAGHIAGATVDNLTDEFAIKTTGGDIRIDSSSSNTTTDGSEDLDLTLKITSDGYTNIADELRRDIKVNGTAVPWRKNLDFLYFKSTTETQTIKLEPDMDMMGNIIYFSGTLTSDLKTLLNLRIANRGTYPFYIAFFNHGALQMVLVNNSTISSDNGTFNLEATESTVTRDSTTVLTEHKCYLEIVISNYAVTSLTIVDRATDLQGVVTVNKTARNIEAMSSSDYSSKKSSLPNNTLVAVW